MGASGATFGYALHASAAGSGTRTLADALNSQLLHVCWQCNPIRRLPNHATSLRKLAQKPHHYGGRPPSALLTTRPIVTDIVCGSIIEERVGRTGQGCRSTDVQHNRKIPRQDKEGVHAKELSILSFRNPTHHYPAHSVQLLTCARNPTRLAATVEDKNASCRFVALAGSTGATIYSLR